MEDPSQEARRWIREKARLKGKSLSEYTTIGELETMADEMTSLDGPAANRRIQEGMQKAQHDAKKNAALQGLTLGIQLQLED
jgi:hypothetical protein